MSIGLRPIGLREANDYVRVVHRHHGAAVGYKFAIGVEDEEGQLRGVAIAGRPVNRVLDDGRHLEVLRVATDGTKNACSMLYGASARAGQALGYRRSNILTYILDNERGASLRASGWVCVNSDCGGGSWYRPSRPRVDGTYPTVRKQRWHAAVSVEAVTEVAQGGLW